MDISRASNFERYVFDLVAREAAKVRELWAKLEAGGEFDLSPLRAAIDATGFVSGRALHADRIATIRRVNTRIVRRVVCALVAAVAPTFSIASDELPDLFVHWYCWYAPPATVSCLLESAPPSIDAAGVDLETLKRLPPGVTELRINPNRLRGEQIDTPLLGSPTDLRFVEILARSVMCGSQQRCTVSFSERVDAARIAEILRAAGPPTAAPD